MKYLCYISLCLLLFFNASAADIKTLTIGAKAPDFNLEGVNGKRYSLQSFSSSKVLVIVFTANHCPTAQAYEDRIKALVTDYKSKGVAVIAISPNDPKSVRLDELGYSDLGDTKEEMKIRAKDKAFNFPYLYDGDNSKTSMSYGPVATPHIFIFDKERKLRYTGRIDDSEKPGTAKVHDARNALNALIAGKPVPVAVTKTFGCSVKWPDKEAGVKRSEAELAKEPVSISSISVGGIRNLLKNSSDTLKLVNVWATWCGPCVTEFPDFIEINRMYRGRNFEFISISADKINKKDKALAFLKSKHASNQNYIYNAENIYDLIEAVDRNWQGALPYTILVAPGGKIIYSRQGTIDPLKMKKAIVEVLGRYYD
jgi:peroxiredoxin